MIFRARLEVRLGNWSLRGDVDILHLARGDDGVLWVLIADMKSSTSAPVEHRLHVAFYHQMVDALLREAGVPPGSTAIEGPGVSSFVAWDADGRSVSTIMAIQAGRAVGIWAMATIPERRRQGAALEVLTHAMAYYQERGAQLFYL